MYGFGNELPVRLIVVGEKNAISRVLPLSVNGLRMEFEADWFYSEAIQQSNDISWLGLEVDFRKQITMVT